MRKGGEMDFISSAHKQLLETALSDHKNLSALNRQKNILQSYSKHRETNKSKLLTNGPHREVNLRSLLNLYAHSAHRTVHCSLTQKWIHLKIPDSLFPLGVICHYLWSISSTAASWYSSVQDYKYYKQMKLSIKCLQILSVCRYALATAWLSFV